MSDQEAALLTAPAAIAAPGFFFSGDDALQLTAWNALASVKLTISGRFIHPDGRVEAFVESHTPNTNRTASTAFFGRGVGWLTDLSIVATGATPLRGQTYVRVDVVRGSFATSLVLSTLLQGYVTATKRVAYPTSPLEDSLSGPGALRSITGTDPAANVEISETVPTGARWRLRTMRATLVTDANVANRIVDLILDDGANIVSQLSAVVLQTATTTFGYTAAAIGVAPTNSDNQIVIPLPPDVQLLAGWRFRTSTLARQVGDNFSAPQYQVEEWLEAS